TPTADRCARELPARPAGGGARGTGKARARPLPLTHDAHVDVPVPLTATANGPIATTINITSDDPTTPVKAVPVTASATPGTIEVRPSALDFGDVCLGDCKTLPVHVANTGGCTLTISAVAITSGAPDFSVAPGTAPITLAAGASTDIDVKFCPTGAFGPKAGNLQITSDDPANPVVNVALTGNAPAPVITVQGCPVNFGTLAFPANATAQIQVCNTGGCTLKLTGVSLHAATAADLAAFSILEPSPSPAA